MPYIKEKQRPDLDPVVQRLFEGLQMRHREDVVMAPGDINYVLSRLIWRLFNENPSYFRSCILRGVLADIKHEFTRRLVDKRENDKIRENGDLPEGDHYIQKDSKPAIIVIGTRLQSWHSLEIYDVINDFIACGGHRNIVIRLAGMVGAGAQPFNVHIDRIRSEYKILS